VKTKKIFADIKMADADSFRVIYASSPGAGENTLRRLTLFLCLDHPTKSDVTSGKKAG